MAASGSDPTSSLAEGVDWEPLGALGDIPAGQPDPDPKPLVPAAAKEPLESWPLTAEAELAKFQAKLVQEARAEGAQFQAPEEEMTLKAGLPARDQTFAEQLKDCVNSAAVPDVRGAVTQRMMRELGDDEKQKLKTMKANEKGQFRKQWAEKKLGHFFERKVFQQAWQTIDASQGTYMSASRVFLAEGGTEDDIEATTTLLDKCVRMGYPFTKYNRWTEKYVFVHGGRGSRADDALMDFV